MAAKPLRFEKDGLKFKVLRRRPGRQKGERTRYDEVWRFDYRDEQIPAEISALLSREEKACLYSKIDEVQARRRRAELEEVFDRAPRRLADILEAMRATTANDRNVLNSLEMLEICAELDLIEEFLAGAGVDRRKLYAKKGQDWRLKSSPMCQLQDKADDAVREVQQLKVVMERVGTWEAAEKLREELKGRMTGERK